MSCSQIFTTFQKLFTRNEWVDGALMKLLSMNCKGSFIYSDWQALLDIGAFTYVMCSGKLNFGLNSLENYPLHIFPCILHNCQPWGSHYIWEIHLRILYLWDFLSHILHSCKGSMPVLFIFFFLLTQDLYWWLTWI